MIKRISRPGITNEYTLTRPEEWVDDLAENRGCPSDWVSGKEGVGGSGKEGALRESIEGNPLKGNPIAPKGVKTKKSDAWREIYDAYPKHVAPAAAQKAIEKALAKAAPEVLMEATQAFRSATSNWDKQFIPHPATWFNAGRWEDDRSTWVQESAPDETPRNNNGEILATGRTTAGREETLEHWKKRILAFYETDPGTVMNRITYEEKKMLGIIK